MEAAKCYLRAIRLGPRDPRALKYLEDLVRDRREVSAEIRDIDIQISHCRKTVRKATRIEYGLPEEEE